MNLIQLRNASVGRRVAIVEGNKLAILSKFTSVYSVAAEAILLKQKVSQVAAAARSGETLDYDPIYAGRSDWEILPAIDHPTEPARCHVAGTGLTHINSAKQRDAMHAKENATAAPLTDSMKVFQWGLEGGKPAAGQIGSQPEWFYKGNGHILRGHNQPLEVPAYADDGGEESELVGIYIIDGKFTPRRIGMATANEFSDHQMERKNYLYLAPCKLRTCSVGPEINLDFDFNDVKGRCRVTRGSQTLWERDLASGVANMSHSLENLEHHHFKYPQHRVPGDIHIHFWGADAFSFGGGVVLQDGDMMEVEWKGYGRALRNPAKVDRSTPKLSPVMPI